VTTLGPRKLTATCPQCGNPVEWDSENRFRPFCSERCKLIDLGKWAAEDYRVPEPGPNSPAATDQ
jgi:uncharacterized protein